MFCKDKQKGSEAGQNMHGPAQSSAARRIAWAQHVEGTNLIFLRLRRGFKKKKKRGRRETILYPPPVASTMSHLGVLVLFPRKLSHESDVVLLEKPLDHGHQ